MSAKLLACNLALCLCLLPVGISKLSAQPAGDQPTGDQASAMKELDEKLIAKQKELMAAKMRRDPDAVERLTKEFKEIQQVRGQAARADERHAGEGRP